MVEQARSVDVEGHVAEFIEDDQIGAGQVLEDLIETAGAFGLAQLQGGTIFADDKLAAAIVDRIVHHGRLIEFHGPSRRMSEALMFDHTNNQSTTTSMPQ